VIFSTLSIYTHTQKTGLDSVVLKLCKKKITLLVFGVNMTSLVQPDSSSFHFHMKLSGSA